MSGDAVVRGLSSTEASRLLVEHGPNRLPEPRRRTSLTRVAAQLRDPMILLLVGAGVVTAVLGDLTDTAVIAIVVVLNTGVGIAQEVRAERAIAALNRLAAPRARVVRDGKPTVVAAGDIVPGDVVHLDAGDVVPADGRLVEAHQVQLDESAMTGESVPVHREVGEEVIGAPC